MQRILTVGLEFILLFPAIILHEIAHGYVAYRLGDPTAKRAGRLTLNPLVHIDPIGTILLPLVLLITTGGFIGWAKPVPINPWNFKDQRRDLMLTGIAGPATNVVLALIAGLIVRFLPVPAGASLGAFDNAFEVIAFFCYANLMLVFFNLIPIPPLDGSRVVQRLLPDTARDAYHSIERYGFLIIFGIIYLLPGLFTAYVNLTVVPVFSFITGLH